MAETIAVGPAIDATGPGGALGQVGDRDAEIIADRWAPIVRAQRAPKPDHRQRGVQSGPGVEARPSAASRSTRGKALDHARPPRSQSDHGPR